MAAAPVGRVYGASSGRGGGHDLGDGLAVGRDRCGRPSRSAGVPRTAPSVKGGAAIAQPAGRTATACAAPLAQRLLTPRGFSTSMSGETVSSGTRLKAAMPLMVLAAAWGSCGVRSADTTAARPGSATAPRRLRRLRRGTPYRVGRAVLLGELHHCGTRPPGDVAALVHLVARKLPPPPHTAGLPTADGPPRGQHRGSPARHHSGDGTKPEGDRPPPPPCKAGPVSPSGGRDDAGPTERPLKAKILR